ncbi:hypothetical protein EOA22_05270 [Mesorhizobium sp. M7A.F.Ca.US.014.04.1.1]|nr:MULTISPECIES: hypothetical protein [Mesorhizobium]RUX67489.1 hypothetical protein EOA22_05270 [Mesorhizobium sp. M7A.F.Ca.US.014.04.1.1]RVB86796.1 hypothetical protein ENZ75_07420 [Mesorhizobium sp. M7A.F.Ca.CA.002.04.1.1]MDF3207945.1 hypothetical protein [Mesorhizobium sp. LMG15046]MDF3229483.1 hypothetical protein [Mesorhizobium sp. DSM 30133]RUU22580.1 hypothetical protein EOC84_05585 [Mesorhizobium sp. Primo-B]
MNDFNKASGLITTGSTDIRAQEARDRQTLENRVAQMRRDHAQSEKDRQEAALQERIAQQTEAGLRANQQLQAKRMGIVNTGQAMTDGQKAQIAAAKPMNGSAPQALVDQLAVTVGGIQLGPQQAKDMAARGEISQGDYVAAVNAALVPYGYSFR